MPELFRRFVFLAAITILSCTGAFSQTSPSQTSITVTVTALGPNHSVAPPIAQNEVTAYSRSERLNVTRWVPALSSGSDLQLAILIDNNLGSAIVGRQLQDIGAFIRSQPPGASVGVFYAENGSANAASPFTTDHLAAAKAVRLTAGRNGGSPSIYLSLSDLVSHWPAKDALRREVLVIASGFDPLSPGTEDPYAESSVEDAEKSGVNVHIILVPNPRYAQTFGSTISEGKLIDAAVGTAGQELFTGSFVPVSLSPYLKLLKTALENQYLLTLTMDRSNKKHGELRPLTVKTEMSGVKLYAPQQVLVPGPEG
jgi:hypothetical protein